MRGQSAGGRRQGFEPGFRLNRLAAMPLVALLLGCGGRAVGLVPSDDAGAAGSPQLPAADPHGFLYLSPVTAAPSVEGDGRLPDLPETHVGEPPIGWDSCRGVPRLSRGADVNCRNCPTAQRGYDYLVASHGEPSTTPQVDGRVLPQAYFYFEEPLHAEALWFDVFWINGSSESTAIVLWNTSSSCDPLETIGIYDAERLLMTPGKWSTACVPLGSHEKLTGLGFRWDTLGYLGMDALRFGPACPEN